MNARDFYLLVRDEGPRLTGRRQMLLALNFWRHEGGRDTPRPNSVPWKDGIDQLEKFLLDGTPCRDIIGYMENRFRDGDWIESVLYDCDPEGRKGSEALPSALNAWQAVAEEIFPFEELPRRGPSEYARGIAAGLLKGRVWGELVVLADLLEDEGVPDFVTAHLRSGPRLGHMPGCWALEWAAGLYYEGGA